MTEAAASSATQKGGVQMPKSSRKSSAPISQSCCWCFAKEQISMWFLFKFCLYHSRGPRGHLVLVVVRTIMRETKPGAAAPHKLKAYNNLPFKISATITSLNSHLLANWISKCHHADDSETHVKCRFTYKRQSHHPYKRASESIWTILRVLRWVTLGFYRVSMKIAQQLVIFTPRFIKK